VNRTAWIVFVLSAAGVGSLQPRLARTVHAVKERDDVYVLPPPADLHASTLGWDAAAVDLLWAKLLVEYGVHWSERRELRDVPSYVDAILEIEPTYAPVYQIVGTLLAYRPMQGTEADARAARGYLERGTRERPLDPKVWLECGEFVAFIGPGFLHSEAEQKAWREDGARFIARAVELGADADATMAAAAILTRSGATDEAVRYLERAYAFTEHPSMRDVHEAIGKRLEGLHVLTIRDRADEAARVIDTRWASELPFLTRDQYVLLGPGVDPARCAGPAAIDDEACARDWITAKLPESSGGSP
jgi:hypothetical protein